MNGVELISIKFLETLKSEITDKWWSSNLEVIINDFNNLYNKCKQYENQIKSLNEEVAKLRRKQPNELTLLGSFSKRKDV